jgi:hypothetical protein
MRISHKYKFIFFATPRTGSTTVRDVLDPYSDVISVHKTEVSEDFPFFNHINPLELKAVFEHRGWDWSSYRKFCFVRNPYDRVVSLYHHYLKIRKEDKVGGLRGFLWRMRGSFLPEPTFAQYVTRLNVRDRLPTSLVNFVGDEKGELMVDKVLQFEEIDHELIKYVKSLGVDCSYKQVPHLNSSDRTKDYRKYYDDTLKQRVCELYKYEIDHFGYEF